MLITIFKKTVLSKKLYIHKEKTDFKLTSYHTQKLNRLKYKSKKIVLVMWEKIFVSLVGAKIVLRK